MPVREIHITETCAAAIRAHEQYRDQILDMMRQAIAHPDQAGFDLFGRRRLEHHSPLLVLHFAISDTDGSITFHAIHGPNTPMGP